MRLLVLTFGWPPSSNVGVVRPSRVSHYLTELGWEVDVIAALTESESPIYLKTPPRVRAHLLPYEGLRRKIGRVLGADGPPAAAALDAKSTVVRETSLLHEIATFPDEAMSWYPAACRKAFQLVEDNHFDLILSTSPPEVTHFVARRVSTRYGIPWVADLRDGWSLDHYRPFPAWKRSLLRRVERSVLGPAHAVVAVSQGSAAAERSLLEHRGRTPPPVSVIMNGFDPEDLPRRGPPTGGSLRLAYAGKLHPVHQNPRPVLDALAELGDRVPVTIDFHLTGRHRPLVEEMLETRSELAGRVRLKAPMAYEELSRVLPSYHALLLFPWQGPHWAGFVPLKVFTYLGARRPILAVGPSLGDSLRSILEETGLGVHLASKSELVSFLREKESVLLSEGWPYHGDVVDSHSYVRRAKTFDELFRVVVERFRGTDDQSSKNRRYQSSRLATAQSSKV